MKFLLLLVISCLIFSGCAGTTQSLKNIPLLKSYSKGEAPAPSSASTTEQPSPVKAPQISPSKAAFMETALLDRL